MLLAARTSLVVVLIIPVLLSLLSSSPLSTPSTKSVIAFAAVTPDSRTAELNHLDQQRQQQQYRQQQEKQQFRQQQQQQQQLRQQESHEQQHHQQRQQQQHMQQLHHQQREQQQQQQQYFQPRQYADQLQLPPVLRMDKTIQDQMVINDKTTRRAIISPISSATTTTTTSATTTTRGPTGFQGTVPSSRIASNSKRHNNGDTQRPGDGFQNFHILNSGTGQPLGPDVPRKNLHSGMPNVIYSKNRNQNPISGSGKLEIGERPLESGGDTFKGGESNRASSQSLSEDEKVTDGKNQTFKSVMNSSSEGKLGDSNSKYSKNSTANNVPGLTKSYHKDFGDGENIISKTYNNDNDDNINYDSNNERLMDGSRNVNLKVESMREDNSLSTRRDAQENETEDEEEDGEEEEYEEEYEDEEEEEYEEDEEYEEEEEYEEDEGDGEDEEVGGFLFNNRRQSDRDYKPVSSFSQTKTKIGEIDAENNNNRPLSDFSVVNLLENNSDSKNDSYLLLDRGKRAASKTSGDRTSQSKIKTNNRDKVKSKDKKRRNYDDGERKNKKSNGTKDNNDKDDVNTDNNKPRKGYPKDSNREPSSKDKTLSELQNDDSKLEGYWEKTNNKYKATDRKRPAFWSEDIQVGCRELRAHRYISDGFCTSEIPIKEVVCAGHCLPIKDMPWYAEFVKTISRTKLRDWQCVEDLVSRKRVKLVCKNLEYRYYRIKVVKSCKCKKITNRLNRTRRRRTKRKGKKKKRRRRKSKNNNNNSQGENKNKRKNS